MSYFKFDDDDIIHNTLKTHPESHFYLFKDAENKIRLVYNNQKKVRNSFSTTYTAEGIAAAKVPDVRHVPPGFVSLYEVNVDRPYSTITSDSDMIYPFITKDSGMTSFSTVSTSQFNSDFAYGDKITGTYAMSASISSQLVATGKHTGGDPEDSIDHRRKRDALRTSFDYYTRLSSRFSYHTGLVGIDEGSPSWEQQAFRLLQIPSIFYGERIKKGTVKLDWYDSGILIATAEDSKQNGEMIVTYSTKSTQIGKFIGLVFYSEGFIILSNTDDSKIFDSGGVEISNTTWKDFMKDLEVYNPSTDPVAGYPVAAGAGTGNYHFSLYFKGTHTIPTMTMLVNVEKGECSHSNNPTFIDSDFQYINVPNVVSVANINNNLPVTFTTSTAHNLGSIGELIFGKISNYSDSYDPFTNHDLRFKIKSTTEFEIYRINDSGIAVPLLDNFIANTPPAAAKIQAKQNSYQRNQPLTGSHGYFERPNFKIKNTVKSSYNDPYAEFEDHTYISKIAIYDEDRNMIGIAKLATPIKKTMKRDFTFKLKLDI